MLTIELLSGVQIILLAIIGFFLKQFFDGVKKYQEDTTRRILEIEHNYLDRFMVISERIAESEKKIIEVIGELKNVQRNN